MPKPTQTELREYALDKIGLYWEDGRRAVFVQDVMTYARDNGGDVTQAARVARHEWDKR